MCQSIKWKEKYEHATILPHKTNPPINYHNSVSTESTHQLNGSNILQHLSISAKHMGWGMTVMHT